MSTPGLKQFDTERDLRSFLNDSNQAGVSTDIAIMDSAGNHVLASLCGCYAEDLAYYGPDENGYMHCCECDGHARKRCEFRDWKPAYPVFGVVAVLS